MRLRSSGSSARRRISRRDCKAIAEPNTVVIAESTRKLLGNLFELQDLGAKDLKGIAESVRAYAALRSSAVESRFEALRTATTPLVGRDEELDLLLRRWEQAKRARLRRADLRRARDRQVAHRQTSWNGSAGNRTRGCAISARRIIRTARFIRALPSSNGRQAFGARIRPSNGSTSWRQCWRKGPMISARPFRCWRTCCRSRRATAIRRSISRRRSARRRRFTHKLAQVEGLAARQPVLMVWEDVHWSDPTTRELLDLLIDRVPTLRVLVILTFRPEFTPPWIGRPHVTMLTLNRLPPRQGAEMIAHVTGGKALPKEIADQIIERTDGVPLFIEELTKTVVESGIVTEAGDHYAVAGPMAPLAIPTSLHASLLARLDRLAPTREVAQIGAALGRSFSHELISAVAGMPQQQIDEALEQLVSAELIFRRGMPPDAEYTFKHALVQDAAYSTLLRSRRQQLHARIVTTLEKQFPEVVTAQPALMAQHCSEAGLARKQWAIGSRPASRRLRGQR